MQQHPIPQNVVTFEDRLIGDFTIRQFLILAVGGGICFGIYLSPLPIYLMYGLIFVIGTISLAMALVKIQGRYLDVWIRNFIMAIFGPTQFIWTKGEVLPAVLVEPVISLPTVPKKAKSKEALLPDLSTIFPEEQEKLEQEEKKFISKINFQAPISPKLITTVAPEAVKPKKVEEVTPEQIIPIVPKIPAEKPIEPEKPVPKMPEAPVLKPKEPKKPERPEKKAVIKKEEVPEKAVKPTPVPKHLPERPPSPKPTLKETEYPFTVRKRVEVAPKNVITPLASEINFSMKPVYTISLAGKEPSYISGLTNLKVNRALKNIYLAKGKAAPVRGEKRIAPSEEFKKRFEKQSEIPQIEELAKEPLPILPEQEEKAKVPPVVVVQAPVPQTPPPIPKEKVLEEEQKPQPEVIQEIKQEAPPKITADTTTLPISKKPVLIEKPPVIKAKPKKEEPKIQKTTEEKLKKEKEVEISKTETAPVQEKPPVEITPTKAPPVKVPPVKPQKDLKPKEKVEIPIKEPKLEPTKAQKQKAVKLASAFQAKTGPVKINISNLINGFVKDQSGKLIQNAIIIVKDQKGVPVRALKSNHLGQFITATPLPNGKYHIEFEKEGHIFDIIEIELAGNVLESLEVKAKG